VRSALALAFALAGVGASAAAQGPVYRLYVAAESADEIYQVAFDRAGARVEEVIEVGYQATEIEGPHGLAVDPGGEHWYVTMAHGKPWGILYQYATGTNELMAQTELGLFPATMQISDATGLLYAVNFDLHGDMSPSSVSVVDTESMIEVERITTGPMPHGSRVSADGLLHYSCAMMSGELFEIDALGLEINRVLQLDEPAPEGEEGEHGHGAVKPTWVYPHPAGERVYVALNGVAQIAEVDLQSWGVTRRFETAPGPYNVELTPDGAKLVTSYKTAGAVGIWDVEEGVELARIPSTRRVTHGVAISPDGRYAFVTNEGIGSEEGTLDVFDLRSYEMVATVEVGLQAGGIAFWRMDEPAR